MPLPPLLVAVIVSLGAVRLYEIFLNARHERRMLARGGVQEPRDGLPWIVIAQSAMFLGLIIEGLYVGRAAPSTVVQAGLLTGACASLALRHWCIYTLGDRWTFHVITLPSEPLVRSGPYHFLRHPNYLAVAVEMLTVPAAFGLWWTTAASVLLGWGALLNRIVREEAVLRPLRAPQE